MAVLRINNADLPSGYTHDFTDWQISTTVDFSNIIARSDEDPINLTTIFFNIELELGKDYYGRARMRLNTGWTEWSNVKVFTPKDVDESNLIMDIPSVITAPTLKTKFDLNSHPSTMFKIEAINGFNTLGNAKHESTSWIIEDSTGKPVWTSLDDRENLLSLDVDIDLPLHNVYHIHASFKGSNGDASQFGTVTLFTSDDINYQLFRKMFRIEGDPDLEVVHPFINGLDDIEWELYSDGMLTDSGLTVDPFFTIGRTLLDTDTVDILKLRTKVNSIVNEWTYIYIITEKSGVEQNTGDNIPYLNGAVDDGFVSFPLRLPHKF